MNLVFAFIGSNLEAPLDLSNSSAYSFSDSRINSSMVAIYSGGKYESLGTDP